MSQEKSLIRIGDGGASGYHDSNTLTSIRYALFLGVEMIQLTVQKCLSGEIYIFPETRIDNLIQIRRGDLPPSSAIFSELFPNEISKLRTKQGYRIPLLSEAIDLIYTRAKINLIVDDLETLSTTLSVIKKYISIRTHNSPKFIISSHNIYLLSEPSELYESVNITKGVIWKSREDIPFNYELLLYRYSIQVIFLSPNVIFSEKINDPLYFSGTFLVKYLQRLRYKVYTTSIIHLNQISKAIETNLNGITSPHPDKIINFLSLS